MADNEVFECRIGEKLVKLPIAKIVELKIPKKMLIVEEMKDGFRLTYSASLFDEA